MILPAAETQRLDALHKLHLLDTPIEERFDRITRMACRLLEVPISAFTLVDEARLTFKSAQGVGMADMDRKITFCTHTIQQDDLLVIPDTRLDTRFAASPIVTGAPKINFYVGCPVVTADGYKIGTLCALDTKPRTLDPEQMQVLRDLAAIVETELRAASLSTLYESVLTDLDAAQRRAMVDPLTHLLNRHGIFEILSREWEDAKAHKTPLAIVIANVDHFKAINDTYTHQVGDEALRSIARLLLTGLQETSTAGRIGGDEFMLVLPGYNCAALQTLLERILMSIRHSGVKTTAGALSPTLSIGAIAMVPDEGFSQETCLKLANEALIQARADGRNRFEIF